MPTRDEICSLIDSYVKYLGSHDVDGLVSLFADDAVQHEPLGMRTYTGLDEIRAFDTENAKVAFTVSRHSPILVSTSRARADSPGKLQNEITSDHVARWAAPSLPSSGNDHRKISSNSMACTTWSNQTKRGSCASSPTCTTGRRLTFSSGRPWTRASSRIRAARPDTA